MFLPILDSWCLWCLFEAEIGAIHAKELKEFQRRDRRNRQYSCGFNASYWKDGRVLKETGWVSHQSHADRCAAARGPWSDQL